MNSLQKTNAGVPTGQPELSASQIPGELQIGEVLHTVNCLSPDSDEAKELGARALSHLVALAESFQNPKGNDQEALRIALAVKKWDHFIELPFRIRAGVRYATEDGHHPNWTMAQEVWGSLKRALTRKRVSNTQVKKDLKEAVDAFAQLKSQTRQRLLENLKSSEEMKGLFIINDNATKELEEHNRLLEMSELPSYSQLTPEERKNLWTEAGWKEFEEDKAKRIAALKEGRIQEVYKERIGAKIKKLGTDANDTKEAQKLLSNLQASKVVPGEKADEMIEILTKKFTEITEKKTDLLLRRIDPPTADPEIREQAEQTVKEEESALGQPSETPWYKKGTEQAEQALKNRIQEELKASEEHLIETLARAVGDLRTLLHDRGLKWKEIENDKSINLLIDFHQSGKQDGEQDEALTPTEKVLKGVVDSQEKKVEDKRRAHEYASERAIEVAGEVGKIALWTLGIAFFPITVPVVMLFIFARIASGKGP